MGHLVHCRFWYAWLRYRSDIGRLDLYLPLRKSAHPFSDMAEGGCGEQDLLFRRIHCNQDNCKPIPRLLVYFRDVGRLGDPYWRLEFLRNLRRIRRCHIANDVLLLVRTDTEHTLQDVKRRFEEQPCGAEGRTQEVVNLRE